LADLAWFIVCFDLILLGDLVFRLSMRQLEKDVPVEISYFLFAQVLSFIGFNFQAQIVLYSLLTGA
jgi:hypothetical protein